MMTAPGISNLVKKLSGFAIKRSMPTMYKTTLRKWYKENIRQGKEKPVQPET